MDSWHREQTVWEKRKRHSFKHIANDGWMWPCSAACRLRRCRQGIQSLLSETMLEERNEKFLCMGTEGTETLVVTDVCHGCMPL